LPSDGAPVTGATSTLTCCSCCGGRVGAKPGTFADAIAGARSGGGSSGTLTPAATWPGERGWKVGGRPIKVATRGAACWAMRDTSRSLDSA